MDVLHRHGPGRLSELMGGRERRQREGRRRAAQARRLQGEAELQRQVDKPAAYGADGARLKQDLSHLAGINAWIASHRPQQARVGVRRARPPARGRKPTDTVAVASLIGGIFGLGGGNEVRNADILHAATADWPARGDKVFRDFAERDDPEAPVTIAKRFPASTTGPPRPFVALTDRGSYTSVVTPSSRAARHRPRPAVPPGRRASAAVRCAGRRPPTPRMWRPSTRSPGGHWP